jgi:hypothetical protein
MLKIFFSLFIMIYTCLSGNAQGIQKFTWVEKSIDEKVTKNCNVDFKYPQFRVTSDKSADANLATINKNVLTVAKEQAKKFKAEFSTLTKDKIGWTEGTLTSEYQIHLANKNIVSLSIVTTKFIEHSAHPSHSTITLNYDFNTTKNIELKNIFKNDSKYLNVLSEACRRYLQLQVTNPNEKWIKQGTEPIAANFKKFYLTHDAFNVIFDEYTVDCYAGGPHTVPVSYSALIDFINPKNPVYIYADRCKQNSQ